MLCGLLQSNHPRLKATVYSLTLTDLRETDEGTYSVSFGNSGVRDIISLKVLGENIVLYDTVKNTLLVVCCIPGYNKHILTCALLDCADEVTATYGHSFEIDIPRDAQYLEFVTLDRSESMVLWNRTGSQVRSKNLMVKKNEITVFDLTQKNSGYYHLRRNDNTLLSRKIVQVKGN